MTAVNATFQTALPHSPTSGAVNVQFGLQPAMASLNSSGNVIPLVGLTQLQSGGSIAPLIQVVSLQGNGVVNPLRLVYRPALSIPSLLGDTTLFTYHDWSGAIPDNATINWVCYIDGVQVPISSWQATLKVDEASYVQAVIPACGSFVALITASIDKDFVIKRKATTRHGATIEQEIARAPLELPRFDRGPTNYTCTISGYEQSYQSVDGDTRPVVTLSGVRSSTETPKRRINCAIDWFLKPGQKASFEDGEFIAEYITYYVSATDSYMSVGEAA